MVFLAVIAAPPFVPGSFSRSPTSHMTFELLQNTSADASKGEEEFGVRILYQEG